MVLATEACKVCKAGGMHPNVFRLFCNSHLLTPDLSFPDLETSKQFTYMRHST